MSGDLKSRHLTQCGGASASVGCSISNTAPLPEHIVSISGQNGSIIPLLRVEHGRQPTDFPDHELGTRGCRFSEIQYSSLRMETYAKTACLV